MCDMNACAHKLTYILFANATPNDDSNSEKRAPGMHCATMVANMHIETHFINILLYDLTQSSARIFFNYKSVHLGHAGCIAFSEQGSCQISPSDTRGYC